ncbi:hypothetical protein WBJ53_08680 [Spirosoma sp. SC4-14]|uniref:hypothetical protein n=1 Tax=Spirosoma sp. SC4-14 TaxID=3128900 RepID=UPI0030D6084E
METLEEAKRYLRRGDYVKIAIGLGINLECLRKTLQRPKAKRYPSIVAKACEVAEFNKSLGLKPL